VRKLTFGMNLSLDGYIAAPGDDIGWSVPSDELFQWWSDRVGTTGLALYGRKLWETMSSHWPTADQQPGATPAEIEFAWVNLTLVETRAFPDGVVLTRYETKR
jgi:dihydrofolate reductase